MRLVRMATWTSLDPVSFSWRSNCLRIATVSIWLMGWGFLDFFFLLWFGGAYLNRAPVRNPKNSVLAIWRLMVSGRRNFSQIVPHMFPRMVYNDSVTPKSGVTGV